MYANNVRLEITEDVRHFLLSMNVYRSGDDPRRFITLPAEAIELYDGDVIRFVDENPFEEPLSDAYLVMTGWVISPTQEYMFIKDSILLAMVIDREHNTMALTSTVTHKLRYYGRIPKQSFFDQLIKHLQ